MNFAVSDGKHIIATRFRNDLTSLPPSLYYCVGTNKRVIVDEAGQMFFEDSVNEGGNFCIVSSEPLSSDEKMWKVFPQNQMILIPESPLNRPTLPTFREIKISPPPRGIEEVFQKMDDLEVMSQKWRTGLKG